MLRVEVTAAMVRSLGEMGVDRVLSDGRKDLVATATRRAQAGLDAAHSGLELSSLELTRLAPPSALASEFDAVQSAFIGAETRKKEAQAFAETVIPQAQAEPTDAYSLPAASRGRSGDRAEAMRRPFCALDREYRANPVVVRERLYRDARGAGHRQQLAKFGGCRRRREASTTGSASPSNRPMPDIELLDRGPERHHKLPLLPRHRIRLIRSLGTVGATTKVTSERMTTKSERSVASARQCLLVTKYCRERSLRKSAAASVCGSARDSLGIGLLGLGTLLVRLAPDQWQIGELCRALAAAVVGVPTLISGLRGVVTGDTRRATDQLVAIAVLAAAASGDFVTATLIPLFLEVGRLFEERSSLGARAAIDGIRALGARQAVRWRNGVEERVDPNSLLPGDEILVRPGERIAVDGTVLEGRAAVDQSAITGESLHEDVGPGSPVFAGTVALDGLLKIQVRGAGADTVLGRVVQLLADVERTSVPVLRLFERRAGVWLPLVLTVAATTLFFTENLSRAIAVLVVATPTALVVAGPAAVVAAMTVATRLRILIKSADFLERASDVDTLILDKTGTVTVGAPTVTQIQPSDGRIRERRCSRVAAACGFGSLHPVSRAVVAEALARGIVAHPPSDLAGKAGSRRGRHGRWSASHSRPSGAARRSLGVVPGARTTRTSRRCGSAYGGRCLGRLVLRDQPRSEARDALAAMRALGINRLVLLTGDRAAMAREVGEALGMDEVRRRSPSCTEARSRASGAGRRAHRHDGRRRSERCAGARRRRRGSRHRCRAQRSGSWRRRRGAARNRSRTPSPAHRSGRHHAPASLARTFGLPSGSRSSSLRLAARGVLDPLTGALAQSVAVLAVVANSARILRFGSQRAPEAPTAGVTAPTVSEATEPQATS